MAEITIVGCGPGNKKFASSEALHTINRAEILIGSPRLIGEFQTHQECIPFSSVTETIHSLKNIRGRNCALLVSGDPGFYSLSQSIVHEFGIDSVRIIPGISTITYAFSKLGIPWHDALFLSAHHTLPENLNERVQNNKKLGILTSPKHTASRLVSYLDKRIAGQCVFYIGEWLSYKNESLRRYFYNEIPEVSGGAPSVLLITKLERV